MTERYYTNNFRSTQTIIASQFACYVTITEDIVKEEPMAHQIYISASSDPRLSAWIAENGYTINTVRTSGIVAETLSDHPDMFMCKMGAGDGAEIFSYFAQNDICIGDVYPHDVAMNAACTGRYFIHNLKQTAPQLLSRAEQLGMILVNVRQGYAKCSTVIVDEDSVITYDHGIAKACEAAGLDVLTVSPGHVLLPGYDTGFIGGASGRIGSTIVFNGDLTAHLDFSSIVSFIEERGLSVKWFSEWPLTDIGSIL